MNQLQTHISEKFNGTIWRIEIDELSDLLFLEIRNSDERKVSFASIDLQSCAIYFKELSESESWLVGIEAAYDKILLVHLYQSAAIPQHKGLIGLDGISGETLWSNYNYGFDFISSEGPICYDSKIQPRKLFLLDGKSGEIIEPFVKQKHVEITRNIEYPTSLVPETTLYKLFPSNTVIKSVQCLPFNNFIIVSLHAFEHEVLKHFIFVFENNLVIYEDKLNDNIQKMQPESFILFKSFLIYIKNNVELKVLSLLKR